MKTLRNLFLEELADRYESEKQLVVAMPKMSEAASCGHLKKLIHTHLRETEGHVTQIEKVFKAFGEKPNAKKCQATVGLIKETEEIISNFKGSPAINAALISCAQKVEHYEIASYGCLHEWARVMGNNEAAGILQLLLDQENSTNTALIELARARSNNEALASDSVENAACCTKDAGKSAPAAL